MEDRFHVEDESGDRKYFLMFPHFILNHSTANDQALYCHMKRYAGEHGECFASEGLLIQKMGIGRKALKKSINYLISRKWITLKGYKIASTLGGLQKVKVYSINDIWKENINYYDKGMSKRAPLVERGSQKSTKGYSKDTQGVSERAPNKNHIIITKEEDDFLLSEDKRNEIQDALKGIVKKSKI